MQRGKGKKKSARCPKIIGRDCGFTSSGSKFDLGNERVARDQGAIVVRDVCPPKQVFSWCASRCSLGKRLQQRTSNFIYQKQIS